MRQYKFMQCLNRDRYNELGKLAKARGVGVQEYLRAVVIPEHLANMNATRHKKRRFNPEERPRR